MTSNIDRRKRSPRTNLIRMEIKREHFQNGVRVKDLAEIYNYSQSTISTILGNKRKLLRTYEINDDTKAALQNIYNNRTLILEMEKLLVVWIKERQKQNESVSHDSICQKALEIYDELKAELPKLSASLLDGFTVSEGWFKRFSKRNGFKINSILKCLDQKELASASGENGASTSDADDPVRQRGLVDEVEDSGNSSSNITDTSNSMYLHRDTKDSLHKLSNCTEYLNNNENIESEFDSSVSTERIENKIGDNSALLRTQPPQIGDNSALLRTQPPHPPPPLSTGVHLSNSVDKIREKALNAEDEFEAFGKYVAMSLRKMPMSNALSVENQIYSTINNERRLILLQNRSGIHTGVEVKMEVQEEPI